MLTAESLPPYEHITCKPISEAAGHFDAAKAAALEAKRTLIELEQTREASEWLDAEAIAKARAEGKADPKRSYVVEHDKKIDAAKTEQKVCKITLDQARTALDNAIEQHGEEFREEAEGDVEMLDQQWDDVIQKVAAVHAERSRAVRTAKALGSDHAGVGAIQLKARDLSGIELAQGSVSTGDVFVETVLYQLTSLGHEPEVEPECERLTRTPYRNPSPVESDGGWQREKDRERQEHADLAKARERELANQEV